MHDLRVVLGVSDDIFLGIGLLSIVPTAALFTEADLALLSVIPLLLAFGEEIIFILS